MGAGRTALSRRLKDMDVIVLEKGDGYGDARIVLNERPVTRQLEVTISGIWGSPLSDGQVKRCPLSVSPHQSPHAPHRPPRSSHIHP